MSQGRLRPFLTLLRQFYDHFAGVTGALGIALFMSHFMEWQSWLLDLVNWWASNVRPIVDFLYSPIVRLLELVLKLDISIPVIIKDYLAVGLVLILSRWRGAIGGWKGGAMKAAGNLRRRPIGALVLLLRTLFAWPAELITLARNAFFTRRHFPERSDDEIAEIRASHLIALLPVAYALVLVFLNWMLALFPNLITRSPAKQI